MNLTTRELHALLRADLCTFIERSFLELNPNTKFLLNWHIELVAAELMACWRGETTRLIINIPPRSLKSHCVSVGFVAWLLGQDPSTQIICASYAQDLANKHALDCRNLMMSSWYRGLFPTRLSRERQAVDEFLTTQKGFRLATSVGGVLTGRGSDFIIIDDPLKPDEALSDAQRKAVNGWFNHSLYSRLNDKRTGRIILIMQRLHEDDLVGHVLGQEPWRVLRLPGIAEQDEEYVIETPYGRRQVHRRAGEALHPEREPLEVLQVIRETLGEYNFAAQYQQSPAPLGGGMVRVEWFKTYTTADLPPKFDTVFQSWDTANKPTELSDYSVCTTWGTKDQRLYLIHVLRKRLGYPDLKRAVRQQAEAFGARTILIEDQASGTQLIQDLVRDGMHGIQRYEPKADKITRMNTVTSTIENGFVHLPEKAPWLAEYLHEFATFPKGKYDDQADSTSQALDWFKQPYHYHGLLELWRQQAEANKTPRPAEPLICPKCGVARAQYGEQWKCNVCGASGIDQSRVPASSKPEKCGKCGATCIVKIGQQWRCQQCGFQWG
jgi:predicted phage terminase large subunit-like protein